MYVLYTKPNLERRRRTTLNRSPSSICAGNTPASNCTAVMEQRGVEPQAKGGPSTHKYTTACTAVLAVPRPRSDEPTC